MNKAERAIVALRECADALDAIPFRMHTSLGLMLGTGPINNPVALRQEADWLEERMKAFQSATEESVT